MPAISTTRSQLDFPPSSPDVGHAQRLLKVGCFMLKLGLRRDHGADLLAKRSISLCASLFHILKFDGRPPVRWFPGSVSPAHRSLSGAVRKDCPWRSPGISQDGSSQGLKMYAHCCCSASLDIALKDSEAPPRSKHQLAFLARVFAFLIQPDDGLCQLDSQCSVFLLAGATYSAN